jgi:hypothetical protein
MRKKAFFVISRDEPVCPICGNPLRLRDHKKRIWRKDGGDTQWVAIGRYRCTNDECHRLHSALPDFLLPYKHYERELVEDVIEGVVHEEDPRRDAAYPCDTTMQRWRQWAEDNAAAMEGQMRSAGVRFLDLTNEFLKSAESLLEELKRKISPGWLAAVIKIIYNSGGRLQPAYSP